LGGQSILDQWVVGHNTLLEFNEDGTEITCGNIPVLGHLTWGVKGFSTAYDSSGRLLFYTDGGFVYGSDHQFLFDRIELNSATFSSQSSSIIGVSPDTYSLFTLSGRRQENSCLENTNVKLIHQEDSTQLILAETVKEKLICGNFAYLSAFKLDCQGDFLLTYDFDTKSICVFRVNQLGIELFQKLPIGMENLGTQHGDNGGIYFSNSTGRGVIINGTNKDIYLLQIDQCSGTCEVIDVIVSSNTISGVYSACFSASGRFLYTIEREGGYHLVQYDINVPNRSDSRTEIADLGSSDLIPEMQIGLDGKIYLHSFKELIGGIEFNGLSIIESPNLKGQQCDFNLNKYSLCSQLDAFSPMPNMTYFIENNEIPTVQVSDTTICSGDLILVMSDDCIDGVYWDRNMESTLIPESTGYYTFESVRGECIYRDSILITVHPVTSGDTINIDLEQDEIFEYQGEILGEVGFYKFNLQNRFGCDSIVLLNLERDISKSYISDIEVPNIFSPNNDGFNDTWVLTWGGETDLEISSVYVLNRWGNIIFKSIENNVAWDGMMAGSEAEQGVYCFIIEYRDLAGKEYLKTGDVTLVR